MFLEDLSYEEPEAGTIQRRVRQWQAESYDPAIIKANRVKANRLATTMSGIAIHPIPWTVRPGEPDLHNFIEGVELFGSRARGNERTYSDYDVILLTKEDQARAVNESVTYKMRAHGMLDGYHDASHVRRDVIFDHFGIDGRSVQIWIGIELDKIDLFCFPIEWRSMLETLQYALPHADDNFMRNIAKEAIPFTRLWGFNFPKHPKLQ